jgi:Primase X
MVVGGKNSFSNPQSNTDVVSDGFDFIVTHFQDPLFPRTISTKMTEGRQVLVFSREEALSRFRESNFLDCRINAYPDYTGFSGINRQAPYFIFIDLDRSGFNTSEDHNLALSITLNNINKKLDGGKPTVVWSGNGFHIYQPVEAIVLELEEVFSKFDQPSKKFLKFAEQYLSNYKSDPSHNPSFKSCMIRIPGSHNSKCLPKSDSEVRILVTWNGIRPSIKGPLLYDFYLWLANEKIKEIERQEKTSKYQLNTTRASNSIRWIDRLLQTPIEDYRKNTVSLILAPYLINIKKMSVLDALRTIEDWLNKCASLRILDSNFNYRVKYAVDTAVDSGIPPMKFDTLKHKNRLLYDKLFQD